jgi:hypothetical protein
MVKHDGDGIIRGDNLRRGGCGMARWDFLLIPSYIFLCVENVLFLGFQNHGIAGY